MATGIYPWCGKAVDKFIMFRGDIVGCRYCGIHTKQTNADRIRSMSDEELADWISGRKDYCPPIKDYACSSHTCFKCWLDWMQEEAK